MTLAIATWNVQWQFGDWETRQPAITETLRALDADVVTLQESWKGQVERLAQTLNMHWTWSGHDPHDDPERCMGNAILSRWPLQTEAFRFLEDVEGRTYRTILSGRIKTPTGILPVFTTHLDHRFDQSATRINQLQRASEFIEDHAKGALPPVLTGDLNAVHDSDEIRKLTGRSTPYVPGRIWTDAWEQVGDGPGITWSLENPYINNSAWPNRRLDYVMIGWPRNNRPVGNPVSAKLFGVDDIAGVTPSDHYGVVVHIATGKD